MCLQVTVSLRCAKSECTLLSIYTWTHLSKCSLLEQTRPCSTQCLFPHGSAPTRSHTHRPLPRRSAPHVDTVRCQPSVLLTGLSPGFCQPSGFVLLQDRFALLLGPLSVLHFSTRVPTATPRERRIESCFFEFQHGSNLYLSPFEVEPPALC